MSTDSNTNDKENKHTVNRLKAHRLHNTVQGTASLTETLQNAIYDNPELSVNSEELDKLNEEVVKLQDRIIKVIKA